MKYAYIIHRCRLSAAAMAAVFFLQTIAWAAPPRSTGAATEAAPPRRTGTVDVGEPLDPIGFSLQSTRTPLLCGGVEEGEGVPKAADAAENSPAEARPHVPPPIIAVFTGFLLFGAVVVLTGLVHTKPKSPDIYPN